MLQPLRLLPLATLTLLLGALPLDRAAAQSAPSIDDPDYASMSARDLYLDRLDYIAEPAAETAPADVSFQMQSRRQDPNEITVETVTIELNDPELSTHEQRSGFSLTSPVE